MRPLLPPLGTDPVSWLKGVALGAPMPEAPASCSRANLVVAAVAETPPGVSPGLAMLRVIGVDPSPLPVRLIAFEHDELVAASESLADALAVVWFRIPRSSLDG